MIERSPRPLCSIPFGLFAFELLNEQPGTGFPHLAEVALFVRPPQIPAGQKTRKQEREQRTRRYSDQIVQDRRKRVGTKIGSIARIYESEIVAGPSCYGQQAKQNGK